MTTIDRNERVGYLQVRCMSCTRYVTVALALPDKGCRVRAAFAFYSPRHEFAPFTKQRGRETAIGRLRRGKKVVEFTWEGGVGADIRHAEAADLLKAASACVCKQSIGAANKIDDEPNAPGWFVQAQLHERVLVGLRYPL